MGDLALQADSAAPISRQSGAPSHADMRQGSAAGPLAGKAWRAPADAFSGQGHAGSPGDTTPPTQRKAALCLSQWDPRPVTRPEVAWGYFGRLRLRVYSTDAEDCSYWTHGSPVCLEHISRVISVFLSSGGEQGRRGGSVSGRVTAH